MALSNFTAQNFFHVLKGVFLPKLTVKVSGFQFSFNYKESVNYHRYHEPLSPGVTQTSRVTETVRVIEDLGIPKNHKDKQWLLLRVMNVDIFRVTQRSCVNLEDPAIYSYALFGYKWDFPNQGTPATALKENEAEETSREHDNQYFDVRTLVLLLTLLLFSVVRQVGAAHYLPAIIGMMAPVLVEGATLGVLGWMLSYQAFVATVQFSTALGNLVRSMCQRKNDADSNSVLLPFLSYRIIAFWAIAPAVYMSFHPMVFCALSFSVISLLDVIVSRHSMFYVEWPLVLSRFYIFGVLDRFTADSRSTKLYWTNDCPVLSLEYRTNLLNKAERHLDPDIHLSCGASLRG